MSSLAPDQGAAPLWVWLFPCTYVAHIAEEFWGGQGFPAWISQIARIPLDTELFLFLNGVGLAAMTACVLIARAKSGAAWLICCLATVALVNGIVHLGASLWTASYSPGVVTGLVFWIPLGAFGLRRLRAAAGRMYWIGITAGFLSHAALSATVLFR